jgi:hypothetical protein
MARRSGARWSIWHGIGITVTLFAVLMLVAISLSIMVELRSDNGASANSLVTPTLQIILTI